MVLNELRDVATIKGPNLIKFKLFRQPQVKYFKPMRLLEENIQTIDHRTIVSYGNCPATTLNGIYRQVAIKVTPA